jgi:HD-like signal output (HDOD) protein
MAQNLPGFNSRDEQQQQFGQNFVMDAVLDDFQARAPVYLPGKPPILAELPPFPAVALRAMKLVSSNETSLRELHDAIHTDQAFASELLRIANCPLYQTRANIKSTMQAVTLLGFKRLKAVVLTIGVRNYLGSALRIPAIRDCWRHCLACAMISEELARVSGAGAASNPGGGWLVSPRANGKPSRQTADSNSRNAAIPMLDKEVAYTAGMIHDLGRLALAVARPEEFSELLKTTGDGSRDMMQREKDVFGTDHCEAGNALSLTWNFPLEFVEVMSRHHAPQEEGRFDLLTVVHYGCRISDALGFGAGGNANPATYEDLVRELPESIRRHFECDQDELTQIITKRILAIEPM